MICESFMINFRKIFQSWNNQMKPVKITLEQFIDMFNRTNVDNLKVTFMFDIPCVLDSED